MVSLLKVLDNPMLDIPMAAVLLSPMFSFSCDELGALFVYHPGKSLYASPTAGGGPGQEKGSILSVLFTCCGEKAPL